MRTVVALARCSHLAPTLAVTAFTTTLAVSVGAGGRAVWVGAAVLAGQLSVGWSNDWVDRGRDRAARRSDKPLVRGDVADVTVARGALAALVTAAGLSAVLGWPATVVHMAAIGMAWAYNLGLKSTPLSVVPYTAAFAGLPAFVTLALQPPQAPPAWAVIAGALIGAGAHFTNTLPDLATDASTGVRGLPHMLGEGSSVTVGTALLAAGAGAVALGATPLSPLAWAALAATGLIVVAVPATWLLRRRDVAFKLAIAAAGGVVATLLLSGSRLV